MARSRLTPLVEAFCRTHGVTIPPGFYRRPTSRYVVIRRDGDTRKLVARTWFAVADVVHYLDVYCDDGACAVFDFHDLVELSRQGKSQLGTMASIAPDDVRGRRSVPAVDETESM